MIQGCTDEQQRQNATRSQEATRVENPPPATVPISLFQELIDAFREMERQQSQRIYELERKVSKFTSVFERMFKEELEQRVNGNPNCQTMAGSYSSMDRLNDKVQKEHY